MLANIAQLSLLTLALPITAFASSHGQLLNRHHNDLAKRQSGNVSTFDRRTSNSRWSFYNVETGNAGSCGKSHVNSDFTVAMNDEQMNSGWCFKNIRMTYNGKTTVASVTDTCPGCPYGGLDLTEGLFQYFAPASVGIIFGDWEFVDGNGGGDTPAPAPVTTKKTTSTWHPPSTTSIWHPPSTTSRARPTTTSTHSTPTPTSTKKTSTSTRASSTSTTRTTSSTSSTSSVASTTSIDYSTGAAAGLAVPTGTINAPAGSSQNIADMYQAFVQVGGLIAGAANI